MRKGREASGYDVVIVGAGASGTLVAANLAKAARPVARIAIVERSGRFFRGAAYSTRSTSHLLNVRAGRMSAFPGEPTHFVDWLRSRGMELDPDAFVSRSLFGRYLGSLDVGPSVRITGEVLAIEAVEGGCRLMLANGSELEATAAVLALGNRGPADLPVPDGGLYASERYISSLRVDPPLPKLEDGSKTLILGTGLSMVDAVLSLLEQGYRGPIHALSRHGRLPLAHGERPGEALELPLFPTLRGLGRTLHRWSRTRAARGEGWEEVVDAIRLNAATQWALFSLADRRRFLRHARSVWDVHRHRIAAQIGRRLAELAEEGRLRIHAGRVRSFSMIPEGVEVLFRPRGQQQEERLVVGQVINCTGPATPGGSREPLLRQLLESGQARLDPLGLGLETDGEGALLDRGGAPSSSLFTLGPQRLGERWETVAIPEIRVQAAALAERIAPPVRNRPGKRSIKRG